MFRHKDTTRGTAGRRRWRGVWGIVAWLCASSAALALEPLLGDQPVRWKDGVIALDDVRTQVRRVAGRAPERVVTLYAGDRIPVGEQWMFIGDEDDPRVLWVEFTHGRVSRVWTEALGDAKPPSQR